MLLSDLNAAQGEALAKELGAIIDTASVAFPKRLGEPEVAGASSRTG